MAQLQFTITNQTISRIDKFNVVAMSQNYLYARFAFLTDDWANVDNATAIFTSPSLGPYKVVLDGNGECLVPWEVLQKPGVIGVSVYGGDRITANVADVAVSETGYRENAVNETAPTTDVLEQWYQRVVDYVDSRLASQ